MRRSKHSRSWSTEMLNHLGSRCLELILLQVLLLLPLIHNGFSVVYLKQMSDRVITTRYGKVRGILVEFPNRYLRPVEAYLGLRYADLDGGGMRFMPPKNPKDQWNGIRVAYSFQPVCPQPTPHEREYNQYLPEGRVAHLRNITPFLTKQKEDCLTLNLYVPIQEWNETTPMAVMVYVHGESYQTGTGNAYDGSVLSSFGDVIVVTLNYRLGVLGFLSTEDHSAMGNYALLDITQALLWLRENIASFSGDPQKVTLFGHGYGAAVVNLLMLSPFLSEGRGSFFQRAILQSGSALSTWAVSYDPKWCTEKLAMNVNCSRYISNTQALIQCLRGRTYEDLVSSTPKAPKYYSCFAPSKDGFAVLPTEVEKLMQQPDSKFASVPVMFGITKNEAYAYLKQQEIRKGLSDFRKTQIIRTYVQNVFRFHRQKIYEILDHHYTDWTHTSDHISNRDNILELLTDGQYVAPLMEMANHHAKTADTYLYSFAYSTQSETDDLEDVQGIHGDELPYVFGAPLVDGVSPFPKSYTNTEKMLSEAVMTYWTNFAKTGNPNQPRNQTSVHGEKVSNRFVDLKWPKYTKDNQDYMPIGRRPQIRHHYRAQKLALWLDLIPKIDRNDGSDRASHLLDNSENMTTYDDSHRLIPNFDNIFPSPPPMPPVRPTPMVYNNDGTWTTQNHYYPDVTDEDDDVSGHNNDFNNQRTNSGGPHQSSKQSGLPNNSNTHETGSGTSEADGVTVEPAKSAGKGETTSGVPLSIVVAIGGSLLLINVLIFAGLCYQRERIKKMRQFNKPLPPHDMGFMDVTMNNRKLESNRSSPCPMGGTGGGPECVSLMSGASAHPHPSPLKGTHDNTHVHNPSPQPSTHSRRGHSQTRATPPIEPVACNYSAVPTNVTSPVHRTHVGVSQGTTGQGGDTNTYVNSKARPQVAPVDVNHKAVVETSGPGGVGGGGGGSDGRGGVGLTTFGPGHAGIGGRVGAGGTGAGGHPAPATTTGSGSGSGGDPLYKTINKSGQNNAVTIV